MGPDLAASSSPPSSDVTALGPVTRLAVQRTSDRVYEAVFAAIRDLRLLPGTLVSETELAKQLQVSRTPVREAIARLVSADLMRVLPQIGTLVSPISMSDVEEARFVRENLEVAVVDLVCSDPSRDVAGLHEHIAAQEAARARGNIDEFFAHDEAMHVELFTMSGYPGAWQAVQRKKVQLDRLRRLSLPEDATIAELIEEHRSIVAAVAAGDDALAREHVRAHARRASRFAPALRHAHPGYFES